jgi:hypothetical protein
MVTTRVRSQAIAIAAISIIAALTSSSTTAHAD